VDSDWAASYIALQKCRSYCPPFSIQLPSQNTCPCSFFPPSQHVILNSSFIDCISVIWACRFRCRFRSAQCILRHLLLQFCTLDGVFLKLLLACVERFCYINRKIEAGFLLDCRSNDPAHLDEIRLRIDYSGGELWHSFRNDSWP